MLKRDLEAKNDPNVYNIAEMGVGFNPQCRFMGFMLEDEGVFGSAHIGIGQALHWYRDKHYTGRCSKSVLSL